ncbi:MAG: hypothetical protein DMF56_01925 [Acidobacteria bacterium]|nr:MAG: hypothetical protein DMF56_01925 [Acidobacteriota bacterium]
MTKSLHVFLDHLIDYAGLFPPAALSMDDAVRNYAHYRDGEYAFALGPFVVPKDRVDEVPRDFPLTILGVDEVKDLDSARDRAFVEIADNALIPELARRGLRAKIRTGGDVVPSVEHVAEFLRACNSAGVAFKATAGLHHPIRSGDAHGFVNVFLAAAMIDHAESILRETDEGAFSFSDENVRWRGYTISTEQLADTRKNFALSFGSCSFEEPIDDLKALGWL